MKEIRSDLRLYDRIYEEKEIGFDDGLLSDPRKLIVGMLNKATLNYYKKECRFWGSLAKIRLPFFNRFDILETPLESGGKISNNFL